MQKHDLIMQEKFRKTQEVMEKIQGTLDEVERILNNYESAGKHFYSELKMEISSNFSWVCSMVREEEERILVMLDYLSESRQKSLIGYRQRLANQMEKLSCLLEKEENSTNCFGLTAGEIDIEPIPFQNGNDVEITFDDKVVNSLRNYCKLNVSKWSSDKQQVRVPASEEKKAHSDLNDSLELKAKDRIVSESRSVSFACDDTAEEGPPPKVRSFEFPLHKFVENTEYLVSMCHVKNPGEFFVILKEDLDKRDRLQEILDTSLMEVPKTVWEDELYLTRCEDEGKWCRVRVVKILQSATALVYKVDYGSTQKVALSSLRGVPEEVSKELPMAVKCKLFDSISSNKHWTPQSMKFIKNLVNCEGTMVVTKVHADWLEVNLKNIESRSTKALGRKNKNVKSHIMSLELSRLTSKEEDREKVASARVHYPTQSLPAVGQILEAVISHVNSPSHFYIQSVSDLIYLEALSKDLDEHYVKHGRKNILYNAKVGMPCASLFSSDGKWYRGKIVDMSQKNYLRVFYVDYGNEETVRWTRVRKLEERFLTRLTPVALCCGIGEPKEEDVEWKIKTQNYLESNIQLGVHRVGVVKVNALTSTLQVSLYGKAKSKRNSESFSSTEQESRKETYSDGGCDDQTPASTISEWSEDVLGEVEEISGKEELSSLEKEATPNPLESKMPDSESVADSCKWINCKSAGGEEIFRPKVEILAANSPSSIYVTFPELIDQLSKLQSELNEFYGNLSSKGKEDWKVGEKCVVYCSERKNWCRAVILQLISNDKVKVFLKDVGTVVTEPFSGLRPLENYFLNYPVYAFKCHMSDVWPVGDTWPAVTCEFLLNEIESLKDIYMSKKGDIESASLPVELWARKTPSGDGGLEEPKASEWVSLNRVLVDEGLALPIVRKAASVPATEDSLFDLHARNGLDKITRLINESVAIEEKETENDVKVSDWSGPLPLKRSVFLGIPTFVDSDAVIYLYDVEEDGEKLKEIQGMLAEAYTEELKLEEPCKWLSGDLCIARYHFDGLWYRGKIIKVNDDSTFEVIFIDYGNIETCQAIDLRKCPMDMLSIPILTHKVMLHGTYPASKCERWPDFSIDLLHGTIVDKACEVTILKHSSNPNLPSRASLKIMECGMDVSSFLQSKGAAVLEKE